MSANALESRDFRLLFAGSVLVSFVMPMQFLTQVFWVQERYPEREVLFIGLLGASRGSAMILFGLVGGALADRMERRRLLIATQMAALAINGAIAGLMLAEPFGAANVAVLLALTFAAAANMAVDQPARQAATPAIVGMAAVPSAIALQMVAQQVTFPLALPLVGFLNGRLEAGQVYAMTLLAWAGVLPLLFALRFRSRGQGAAGAGVVRNVLEGLRYTRAEPTIFAVIVLVLAIQLLGMPGPASLGPSWMRNVLGLSETQFGFMAMTWGLGTMAASLFYWKRNDLPGRGLTLWAGGAGFGLCALVFAYSRLVPLTALANFGLGFMLVTTMVSSSTITQQRVEEAMRGRVMGLFPLAMGLAMLAAFPVGAAAQATSMETVFPVMAWATLAAVAGAMALQPGLRREAPRTA
ncbi:MFS transporter [Tepidiforma bonchosmolovskayae]|uniref:MFS transporter n=1 Tax=Tepidiforma bonchosmolovskayae TaxID=2601677 RepID=A0ABX6C4A5_9CHLR|nr:MFS transporter [Tepidiforma bonchosmolovskayae]QFG03276.1 MFS transporter [Tepidiforma bonchosmolovskayae]